VTNDITIRYPVARPDAEVPTAVKAALDVDVYAGGLPIRTTVKDGQVQLQGSVGSWYTRRRVENPVRWIAGLRVVKNDLAVVWAENEGARTAEPAWSDAALAERVLGQLHRDSRIDAAKIEGRALSGEGILSGSLPYPRT